MSKTIENEECCPKFNPEPWDDKIIEWNNKSFVKDSVKTFFFMPLNFGSAMRRLSKLTLAANAECPDWLCLSDHTSKWNMDVYLAVDKKISGADNREISGKFYCRVYEGPFKDTGKWGTDYKKSAEQKNLKINKWYMWYTTCPKCAKKYGKNYVVFFGKTD